MRTIDQSNYEEWIFEYYEGTLTAEEEAQVLDFLQRNSAYMDEFEVFSKTYLREPLPDKLSFESTLLRKESYFNINYVIASFLVIIVSGLFFIKKNEDRSEAFRISKESDHHEVHQQKEIATKVNPSSQNHNFTIPKLKRIESLERRYSYDNIHFSDTGYISVSDAIYDISILAADTTEGNYNSLPSEQTEIIKSENLSVGNTITTIQRTRQEKKEAKRKLKQIARFKEKQRRNKDAQKLMKGNMPYVIPLDPNTF